MDRLSSRNYFVVVVAGMFCLLSASVVSADVPNNAVGWFKFAPSVRARFIVQEANIAQNSSDIAGSFGTLTFSPVSVSDDSAVAVAACPASSIVLSANCDCSDVGGTQNFGVLFVCQLSGNSGIGACLSHGSLFDPLLPPPRATVTAICFAATANDGSVLGAIFDPLPNTGEKEGIIGGSSSNQKGLPRSPQISGSADAELDAVLNSIQNQILDYTTALQERQRQKSN